MTFPAALKNAEDLTPEQLEERLKAMIALKEQIGLHENADVEAVWLRQVLREWKRQREELEAWERRWNAIRWCHSGCNEGSKGGSGNSLFGYGDFSPFL